MTNESDKMSHPPAGLRLGTFRATLSFRCNSGAAQIVDKVTHVVHETLLSVDKSDLPLNYWRHHLPSWLLNSFRELTAAQAEEIMNLPLEQRVRAARDAGWSLENWLYWFRDTNRSWEWKSALALSDSLGQITLAVDDVDIPLAAFCWLVETAGATEVKVEFV